MGSISSAALILLVQLIFLGLGETITTTESKNCSQINIIHQDLHCDGPGKFPLKDTCEFYYECTSSTKKGTAEGDHGRNNDKSNDSEGYQLVKARCPEGTQFDGMECLSVPQPQNETSAECPPILCPILGDFQNVPVAENENVDPHTSNETETKHNGTETEPDSRNATTTVTATLVLVLAPDNLTGDPATATDGNDEGVMLGDDPAAGTGSGADNGIFMRSGSYKASAPKSDPIQQEEPSTTSKPDPAPVTEKGAGGHDDHSGHSHDHGHRHSHNRRKVVKNGGVTAITTLGTGWSAWSHILALVHVVWPMFFAMFL